MKTKKLKVKDIGTIVIFSAIALVIQFAIGMASAVNDFMGMVVMPSLASFAITPLYIYMAYKVNKPGVLFLFNLVRGLFFLLAAGGLYMLLLFIIVGVLSELTMIGKNSYRNLKRNIIGWGVTTLLYAFHLAYAMLFFKNQFLAAVGQDYYQRIFNITFNVPYIIIIPVLAIIAAIFGCLFGRRLFNKHFKKSGLV